MLFFSFEQGGRGGTLKLFGKVFVAAMIFK